MTNPLAQFVSVEERADGVYIKVPREKKGEIRIGEWKRALDSAGVLNYDLGRIDQVIRRASGAAEKIGPPFEVYDRRIEDFIQVQVTDKQALMRIDSNCVEYNVKPTPAGLVYFLGKSGVKHGMLVDTVQRAAAEMKMDADIVVARAVPPQNGEHGRIDYEIEINPNHAPQMRSDGSVDYRDIHAFVHVAKGQAIAHKVPPTPGKPGMTVTGKEIPPTPGKEAVLPGGENTYVSDDGSYLMAGCSGVLRKEGDLVHIHEELTVPGDVDFSAGNVKHSGNVIVNGDVKPGFSVDAEGDITIRGIVESANVCSRSGSVRIVQGVLGKGESEIRAGKGITVGFVQDATVEAGGKLVVEKHCLHCRVRCDMLEAGDRQSSVVGGEVRASEHIKAYRIGNEKSIETRVSIIDKEKELNKEKLKELEELRKKIGEKLEPVKKQVKSKSAILRKAGGNVTGRAREETKKWIDAYNSLNAKAQYVDKKIAELGNAIKQPRNYKGYIKVEGDIFPGAVIDLYGSRKAISQKMSNKVFRLSSEGVEAG